MEQMKGMLRLLVITSLFQVIACSPSKNLSQKNPKGSPISHTPLIQPGYPVFLFLSDIHLDTFSDTTSYGLDTGMGLWKIFLKEVDSLLGSSNPPQFVVYTGDLPAHYTCSTPNCYLPAGERQIHNRNLSTILTGLRNLVTRHHTPLFYIPGNNDGLAGNYYSFADENNNTAFSLISETVNPYPALNINQTGTMAPCMISNSHPTMGYYSARAIEGLRIIALNTVMFSKKFNPVDGTHPPEDGKEQLNWLSTELKDAAEKGDKVYLAMHIPPGLDAYAYSKNPDKAGMWVQVPDSQSNLLNGFLSLVSQYQNTITGILFGHTHMDELRRLYDPAGTHITEVAISCPGLTPQHMNNPGFKIVQFDRQTMELMDFTTYYTQPAAQSWGGRSYSFNGIFGYPAGNTLYKNVSTDSIRHLQAAMNRIYTVMNGAAGYDIQPGIEVKTGQ